MLIVGNGKLFTRDEKFSYIVDGAAGVEGTKIAAVGTSGERLKAYED